MEIFCLFVVLVLFFVHHHWTDWLWFDLDKQEYVIMYDSKEQQHEIWTHLLRLVIVFYRLRNSSFELESLLGLFMFGKSFAPINSKTAFNASCLKFQNVPQPMDSFDRHQLTTNPIIFKRLINWIRIFRIEQKPHPFIHKQVGYLSISSRSTLRF